MENTIIVSAFVIGFTQLVKSVFDSDYRSVVIILGAALIGGISGFFEVQGLNISTGIVAGIASSGVVTLGQALGGSTISSR